MQQFRYGLLTKQEMAEGKQSCDESAVAAAELIEKLNEGNMPEDRMTLSRQSGVPYRMLQRILGTPNQPPQTLVCLGVAMRLLDAVGNGLAIHEMTVVPFRGWKHAVAMATYEFIDSNERLVATPEQIKARAQELLALRESIVNPEIMAAA